MKALLKVSMVLQMCLANAASATTILHVGTLIDGVSDTPQDAMSIIVEADRIDRVVEGYIEIDQATVIDLKQATLMPGFIDMHVHLDGELNPPGSYSERFYMNSADIALRSTHYAALTLKAGFTTVRDLGTSDIDAISALRDAINQDLVMGPRIFMAGKSLAATGGHADPTNGIRSDLRHDPGPKEGVLNGPDDAYKAVR
jgi:imidazolonepropionase-like amidohydrolase